MYEAPKREKGEALLAEWSLLAGQRSNEETVWQEIAERIFPAYSQTFSQKGPYQNAYAKNTDMMFDSTGSIALGRFASILDSMLTPRNSTWHRLVQNNPELAKIREVKLYCEQVTKLLFKYRYAPLANFASQNNQVFESLGAFGSGVMFIDELTTGKGMRYRSCHLGENYFRENHQGLIDSNFRYFPMTIRQAWQKWGEKLPEILLKKLATHPDTMTMFLHAVKPREDYDPTRLDYKSMKWSSDYVAVEGKTHISESGYSSFPYGISRYKQGPGEKYGRSPAMECLPSLKTLNEQKKTLLKQGHRAVDPVLLGHDDGVLDTLSLRPGAYVSGAVTADGRSLIHALPVGNVAVGKDMMDDERKDINDAFLVTLFQIMTESPQMTATEIIERTKEKGILLAPTLGRVEVEYLGTTIEREADILSRQGLLPPMPAVMKEAGADFGIQYDSPLSRAAQAQEASGLMRTVEYTLQVVNVTQDPAPLDYFDWDVIIPEVADIHGVPERWKRSAKKIEEIRNNRASAQETQDEVAAAPGAAAMMKAAAAVKKA